MRNARITLALTAVAASFAATAVQAQEANAWDVADLLGRNEMAPMAQASRHEVAAELQRARDEGTYHAGNEAGVPQAVLERRVASNQREADRIARAYREEAERIARMNAQPPATPSGEAVSQAVRPSPEPVVPSSVAPLPSTDPTTAAPATPDDRGAPTSPDVRPNAEMAVERRAPAGAGGTATPPIGSDGAPGAPDTPVTPGTPARDAGRVEQRLPAPQSDGLPPVARPAESSVERSPSTSTLPADAAGTPAPTPLR